MILENRPLLRRWLIRLVIAAGAILIALLLLLWAATGPLGRWAVVSLADDRALPRGLVLDIEDLQGNVLARPALGRLAISDADGEFLIIDNLELRWDGLALLSGRIDIETVTAGRLEITRRPALTPSTSSGGSLPSLRINQIEIAELAIGAPVPGTEAAFAISGEARIQTSGRLAVEAVRTDIEGDRLSAEIRWSDQGSVTGQADVFVAGDSPLAALLQLEGLDTQLTGELSGDSDQGSGTAEILLGNRNPADLEFGWSGHRWTTRAYVDGSALPERFALPFDATSQISASGPLSPLGFDQVEVDGRDWQIAFAPGENGAYDTLITLSADFLSIFTGDNLALGRLRWDGTVDTRAGLTADGILELGATRVSNSGFEALGGGLTLSRRDGQIAVFADLTATDIALPDTLPVSGLPWAGLTFEARQAGNEIDIPALTLSSDLLTAEAELAFDLAGRDLTGWVTARIEDTARLSNQLSGPLDAEIDLASLSREGARLGLRLDGSELVLPDERLDQLLRNSRLTGQVTTDYANWQIQGLRWQSGGLLLTGQASGEGARWATQIDAAINGDFSLASASMQGGAAIALQASGEGMEFAGTSVISTPHFILSGQAFDEPRLGLDFSYGPDVQQIDWQVETGTRFGQLMATGDARRGTDTITVDIANGQLGERAFTGMLRSGGNGLTARVIGSDWAVREGMIETFVLDIEQNNGDWHFGTQASGALRHPFSLTASAVLGEESVSAELSGEWADIVVRTREPLTYSFGGETPGLLARLRVGSGRANIRWTAEEQFRVRLEDLPADLFVSAFGLPELSGTLAAEITFRDRQGLWSGEISANAADLRIRQFAQAAPVSISATGSLDGDLSVQLDLTGDDLTGTARLTRAGRISDLGQLREDAPIAGNIELSGAIEPLLTLLMPDTRHLAGQLSADLAVSGSVFQPSLRGTTRFENGRYMSEELGVNVDTINGAATFDDVVLRLDNFSARDPRGGTLTASGEARQGDEGWQAETRLEFTNFNAIRRPDLNVVATGSSDITLARSGIAITGEAELDRIDARPPDASATSFAEIEVTEINRPDGQNGRRRNRIPVSLDYRINAPGNIFISGEPFSSEWRGSWHVRGSPDDLDITGDANLISGRAFLLNRAFRLEQGRVTLAGSPRSAEIDLLAIHTRDSLTVNARLTGPATAPTLNLSSEPALPQDEILARLLFDQNASQLSPLQTATIAAQLSGQNLFGMVGSLRRAAGLDRLDFDTTSDGQLIATAGQQLTEDVYLELESRGTALSSARLEWTLTPDFTLLSRLTGDTDASIALRWRTEFD